MLKFDVKRKINTLRDILVGKVPDPKAQVEQITIALIYKFMDDMDLDGVQFGGNREFFKEEYEKYAFSQIMQPENSAQQRMNLFAEGIDRMAINPYLPQLFRDIFRGAYIPYRDPETLNMFMKEIAEFTYSNSEDLGNAFEYLLSIMGSQGDAGQFRTPRHIIDMMVEITAPQKNETVLDPACGTSGFLISAFKYIEEHNRDQQGASTLSADDRNRITANFAGYDISPDMVRLSRVNLYLHRFTKPQISEYDTLTYTDKWDDTYDVILANPPFMTPKGGIIPHNRYRVEAKRSEVLFVDYIAEHLNPTGRAAVIVPEGIVFQTANAYKQLRQYLVDDGLLYAVISLPAGVFNPYSGVKTSILLMNKTLAKTRDYILFVKLNNDGFDLGAQRREIKLNDIPDVINVVKDYIAGRDVSEHPMSVVAKKAEFAERDYILVGERYKETKVSDSNWHKARIIDISERITKGTTPTTVGYGFEDEGVNFIKIEAITDDGQYIKEKFVHISLECNENLQRSKLKENDVLFSIAGALGRVAIVTKDILPANTNQALSIITPITSKIYPQYLFSMLRSSQIIDEIMNLKVGAAQFNLSLQQVGELQIPLPPLSMQEEIVAEIEGYQKIIDGARQVVENYKPTIKVDPKWEMARLGDVCVYDRQMVNSDSGIYVGLEDIESDTGKISADTIEGKNKIGEAGAYVFTNRHILYGRLRPYLNKVATPDFSGRCSTELIPILANDIIEKNYLAFQLRSKASVEFAMASNTGARMPRTDMNAFLNLPIPLPLIDDQREIIVRIQEEIAIVEQNKRLIEIFEQKIKDRISEVWGE